MSSKKNIALVIASIVIGGVGIYSVIRYIKGKKIPSEKEKDVTGNVGESAPVKTSPIQASAGSFPLKFGSKNSLVGQLQTALGISSDNAFGAKTQAALLAQTGKLSITTQQEFNTIITSLSMRPAIAANIKRADSLIATYKNNTLSQMMAINNITAYGGIEDTSGAFILNNKNVTLKSGVKLSRADYVPYKHTAQGYLVFIITTGTLKGTYKVDPNKITLVTGDAQKAITWWPF